MTSICRKVRKLGAILACAMSVAGLSICLPAHAAGSYPSKPIRFIVPYPPGGGTDIVARLVAEKMRHKLGQPILVENKSGASTVIGTEALARAEPDGYTIGLVTDSHILNPFFKTGLPYDPVKDFQPVSQLTLVTLMLVANPKLHVKSLKELITLARSEPGKLSYASIGTGTPHEVAMEWLKSMAKINLIEVPYRGVAPALSDVVGGQVDVMFTGTSSAKPFIDSGKLVPLGVSSAQRLPSFPDVPAVAEAGLPGYDLVTWYGVLAPAGTPPGIVEILSREIASALSLPDVKKRLDTLGVVAAPSTPKEFGEFMQGQSEKMARIIKETGLKAK